MIISRHKYDERLKEAYEKGRYEAEERFYHDRAMERLHTAVGRLEERVRKIEKATGIPDLSGSVREGCPFD